MGFTEAITSVVVKNYATFSGRASRSEFWWFFFFYLGISILLEYCSIFIESYWFGVILANVIIIGFELLLLVPFTAVLVRRLHDKNMSGWWSLVWIVFLALVISEDFLAGAQYAMEPLSFIASLFNFALFISFAFRGTPGVNRFGVDPLDVTFEESIFN